MPTSHRCLSLAVLFSALLLSGNAAAVTVAIPGVDEPLRIDITSALLFDWHSDNDDGRNDNDDYFDVREQLNLDFSFGDYTLGGRFDFAWFPDPPSDAHESEYRAEMVADRAEIQAYYDANPIVPPSAQELLAGAVDPEVLALGETFFLKTCASCHGDQAQGLIGPNLTDDHWLHGGKVTEVFQAIVKGVPAKGMPPWGRAFAPEELTALAAYVRSLNGTKPPKARTPEGRKVAPEPLPAP